MKSLERRFNNITEKKPNQSSYLCFAEAIKRRGFSQQTIHRWFQKLVDKSDYAKGEKKGLLENLGNLSNPVRTTEIEGKTASQTII
ncbi:MAG: hypothetical protein US07_C0005G0014 [Candidatus Levybacteria bacterium GW2011_GWB1_36_18]|nr:MAG: hypothetical protein US07_C0005G0014 [Candidatus Levybacteria bacterium GW2011_GWB1_36_18]